MRPALTAASTIENDFDRVEALNAITPRLPASDTSLLHLLFAAAATIQYDSFRAYALSAIAPCLPALDQKAILVFWCKWCFKIQSGQPLKAEALDLWCKSFAYHFIFEQKTVLRLARAFADTTQDDYWKAIVLNKIALCLPAPEQRIVMKDALAAASIIYYDTSKALAIDEIALHLTPSMLKPFLDATLNHPEASKLLATPANRFPEDFLLHLPTNNHSIALEIVPYLSTNEDKTKFLSALVPRILPGQLAKVPELIRSHFLGDRFRAEALNNVIPYLAKDELSSALNLIIHQGKRKKNELVRC